MPADKELTKGIKHKDIRKTAKSIALPGKRMCKSGSAWELGILCPERADSDKPEFIGDFGGTFPEKCNTCKHNNLTRHGFYGRIHVCSKNRSDIGESMVVHYHKCQGKHYEPKDPKNIGKYGGRPQFERPGSALRRSSKYNPRNLPCPTCKKPNKLTPADKMKGYQCDECADRAERMY